MSTLTRNPRILLVVDSLDVGGAEAHVVGLGAGLRRLGIEVEIACSVAGGLALVARAEDVPVSRLMDRLVKRTQSHEYNARMTALALGGAFDVIHAHMHASALAASAAASRSNVPLVVTVHSEGRWRDDGDRTLTRDVYGRASRVIAVSSGIRSLLVKNEAVPPEKVEVIMNTLSPVWRRAWATAPRPAIEMATSPGPVIGVIARLQPDKGVEQFIAAAGLLHHEIPDAMFVIVGDGPLREALADMAESLGLTPRLRFVGYLPYARPILEQLDVLVVPSVSEGSPMVILEAMEAGVPIVASAVGGIPEQVSDAVEALLIPAADPQAIARAVLRLHKSPALAQSLAGAARGRFLHDSNHQEMILRTLSVYRDVLQEGQVTTPLEPLVKRAR